MRKQILNLMLVVIVGLLGIGGLLALGDSSTPTAFQSPLSPQSLSLSHKVYLPLVMEMDPPPSPFLRAPYYGTKRMSAVFDHNLPGFHLGNDVTLYTGITTTTWGYDGHFGYDYVLSYEPVLAAANGRVSEARWYNPANHRGGYGLFVRMDHDNGYATLYGHLSAIVVDVGTDITDAEAGRAIGTSGNTGSVSSERGACDPNVSPTCGAHLHFELRHNNYVVDPFGWIGDYPDPWITATSHNVWLEYPAISNGGIYPFGTPRSQPAPPPEANAVIVDDGDTNYTETPNCWTVATPAAAYEGDLRYTTRVTDTATCSAQWNLPAQAGTGGDYQVYAHVISYSLALPEGYVSTQGVTYTIRHAGQTDTAILNQWAFTNTGHTSSWVYLGTYFFNRNGGEYVSVSNLTYDHDAERYVLADAVKFVPLNPPPTLTPTPTRTPSPTPTCTPTPVPTPTRTPTPVPCPPTSGPYEPNNSFAQAKWLTGSVSLNAYIECAGDNDYYAFQTQIPANQTRHMEITLTVPSSADYDLFLYDSNQYLLRSSTNSGSAREYIYYAIAGGPTSSNRTFYILVKPYGNAYRPDASYRLQLKLSLTPESIPQSRAFSVSPANFSSPLPIPRTFFSPLSTPAALALPGLAFFNSDGKGWLRPMDWQGEVSKFAQLVVDFSPWIGPGCELLNLSPSPDGRYLAAQVNCEWGGYVLLADWGSGQVTRLRGALGQESIFLDWMPGGEPRLAVQAEPAGDGGVYLVDPRTLEAERLPVPGETYEVAFSPDGERVLFAVTEGLGHGSEMWVMNRDGSGATRLLHEPQHIIVSPRWSPDGRQVAYIRMVDNEVPFTVGELWVLGKGEARMLSDRADAGHGYGPVWSPDGQYIAFVARENAHEREADLVAARLRSNLYLAEMVTGQVKAITRYKGALIEEPVWAPDGQQMAFRAVIGETAGVWLISPTSGRSQLLIDSSDVRAIIFAVLPIP